MRALLAGVLTAVAIEAGAQESVPRAVPCAGQTISDIEVRTRPPFDRTGTPWYRAPLRVLEGLHSTTRPSVVRRYILLEEGQPCREPLRRDSERLLRGYPFLASATVASFDDGAGGVRIVVTTVDELTAVVGGGFRGSRPYELTLGERNVGGTATEAIVHWRDGHMRDGWGIAVTDHQFLGLPYELDLVAERGDAGERRWRVQVTRDFLIESQRRAWRVTAAESDEVFAFERGPDLEPVAVGVGRHFVDVGGVVRVGPPGRLSLFGLSFSREDDLAGLPPRADTTGQVPGLLERYSRRRNARVNALWAFRALGFTPGRRFDALTGTQDLAHGLQLGVLFGRSLSILDASDDDIFVAADLYAGAGTERSFVRLDARAEGREDYDANEWDGILASGRISAYKLVGVSHTLQVDAEWSGGWRQRVPFQLTLGNRRAGVRGHGDAREAGSQRFVVRAEDRWLIDTWRRDADVAAAMFVDAGRMWAGDVPYGVDTPIRIGAGVGLLAAIPSGSRRTYRVELAFPVNRPDGAKWEMRFSIKSLGLPVGWREPDDVARSRERAVPRSIF